MRPRPAALGRTVLVVEDSRDLGALLATALEEEGCVAHLARRGEQAVELARRLRPDLITLDLGLPDMDGGEVLARLRADPATGQIPVVAVSAHAGELEPALEARLARVIRKPFYLSEVVAAVLESLGQALPGS